MPTIDVYAVAGAFSEKNGLAQDLARAVMRWEAIPEIPLFAENAAALIHDLPGEAIPTAAGRSDYARVQVLTLVGALDRDKQLGVVKELTEIAARAAGDSALAQRTWCCSPSRRRVAGASRDTPTRRPTSPLRPARSSPRAIRPWKRPIHRRS